MSSQRGNCAKSGPQKHQNTKAYRNDLHRKDKTIKVLNSLQIAGCCKRCKEVIEWKIKYNKYKPLTRPKKCVKCLQKNVTNSYFIICQNCIESQNLCGKCASVPPTESSAESSDAVASEINTKSSITSGKRKPEEEDDDSDDDDDDSDLDNEVEKVLTINDKARSKVSIKPNQAKEKDGTTSKNVDMPKASDKHKVTFDASESECNSEKEQVDSVSDNEDDKTAFCVDDKKYEGKEKLNEGKDKLDEGKDSLNEDKDKLNEDKTDRNKLSTNVKKGDDDQSELDESDGEDDDEDGEENDGDLEDEDDN